MQHKKVQTEIKIGHKSNHHQTIQQVKQVGRIFHFDKIN
jgi:hypothetical protein